MKQIRLITSIFIVMVSAFFCFQIVSNSFANQKNKENYAELNHIKYGLFSIDAWKRQVTVILTAEINKIYLPKTEEKELKKHIETILATLIDTVAAKIKKENSDSAGGWIKQSLMNIFVSFEDIKKGIPEYGDEIIREMTTPKTKRQIKTLLQKQLAQYFDKTFDTQDKSRLNQIVIAVGSKDIESARIKLAEVISAKQEKISTGSLLLIILSAVLFSPSGFTMQSVTPVRYILLVVSLVLLLVAGITTPMIDMEAKIVQMSFVLMGHPILFENQVLYFQSKSILDVFLLMINHENIEMKGVAILLVTFSVFFPLLKILSSFGYYFNFHNARNNSIISFFVLKSGKWSMADVMVVAIFMAYIGFDGIMTSQFGQLNSTAQELVILTTNATSLQPGYYLFLTYTLLALFISGLLAKSLPMGKSESM